MQTAMTRHLSQNEKAEVRNEVLVMLIGLSRNQQINSCHKMVVTSKKFANGW